jgi:hypothetical protein
MEGKKEAMDYVKKIEEMHPGMTRRYKEIMDEQYSTFCRKQYDYGSSNISLGGNMDIEADRRMSLKALVIRMNDKANRLLTILLKHNGENAVPNETYIDAFQDTSVYGIIAQLVDEGVWGK